MAGERLPGRTPEDMGWRRCCRIRAWATSARGSWWIDGRWLGGRPRGTLLEKPFITFEKFLMWTRLFGWSVGWLFFFGWVRRLVGRSLRRCVGWLFGRSVGCLNQIYFLWKDLNPSLPFPPNFQQPEIGAEFFCCALGEPFSQFPADFVFVCAGAFLFSPRSNQEMLLTSKR